MRKTQLIFNKTFLLGFLSGTLSMLLVLWIFVFKYPLLLSSRAKASYSIGLQIGQNFKNQKFDISSIAFSAAMRDVVSEKARLSPSEMTEAKRFLFSQTPQSQMLQKQMKLHQVDENGFFDLESGTKFKFLAEPKSRFKNKNELSAYIRPATEYRFQVTDIFDNKKKSKLTQQENKIFKFKRQQLKTDFIQILDYLDDNESVQVYFQSHSLVDIINLLRIDLDDHQQLIIKRMKVN